MSDKKKKFIIFILSGLCPVLIFLLASLLNGFIPFGTKLYNQYDSFTQYPGFLLELGRLLKTGNIFYSWRGGLGFNFFGSITYYGASPLNLFCLFANSKNYGYIFAFMIYLRFFLLGLSMCFYLYPKQKNKKYVILFSTIYALMGYTSCYYYNYLWIDSVIMLPLVIHGLDKLIDKNKPAFYALTLLFTILINYYIGYMICIFCLIYFIYRYINLKEKNINIILTFAVSSLLAGLASSIVILPSFFALLTGKASLYGSQELTFLNKNIKYFFYSLTPASFFTDDQGYGPAQAYTSLLILSLTILLPFNKKINNKEKISSFIVILIFLASFFINKINIIWQFFQVPIWWQSRFSFLFSFFLLTINYKNINNISSIQIKWFKSLILCLILIVLIIIQFNLKIKDFVFDIDSYRYIFLGYTFISLIFYLLLRNYQYLTVGIYVLTMFELGINSYNNLFLNGTKTIDNGINILNTLSDITDNLDQTEFYRMESVDRYISNDGMYFGYNGINYFNSSRNVSVINLFTLLGLKTTDNCYVNLDGYDPAILSLFNIKYLYGTEINYYKKIDKLYYNSNYLSIGFIASDKIIDITLNPVDYLKEAYAAENINTVYSALYGKTVNIEKIIYLKDDLKHTKFNNIEIKNDVFRLLDDEGAIEYTMKSDGHYLLKGKSLYYNKFIINGQEVYNTADFVEINKGDIVNFIYTTTSDIQTDYLRINLFDLNLYEKVVDKLDNNMLINTKTNENGNILSGSINVPENNSFLFTSVEFEKGMKIFVDGVETKPEIVLNSLVGLHLNKGQHYVKIKYIPEGLKQGLIISIFSTIILILYLAKNKSSN